MSLSGKIIAAVVVVFICIAFTQIDYSGQAAGKEKTTGQFHKPKKIVDIASHTDNLSTFVAAIKTAGLVKTLNGDGPFTVFVPTDSAFATLPEGTFKTIMKPAHKNRLRKILTYHVIPREIELSDLKDGKTFVTVAGKEVKIYHNADSTLVNYSRIVKADVVASNGIIHVVDKVLMPPQ